MITVDKRQGSAFLIPHFEKLGVEAELGHLDYGDAAFTGRGPNERPVPVGIEIKTLPDLLSSLTSGRLMGHQLPGLLANYEYVWLVVQGNIRVAGDGELFHQRSRRWYPVRLGGRVLMWRDLSGLMTTLEVKAGVHVRHTSWPRDTALTIAGLHRWWTSKSYAQHRSHLMFHNPPDVSIELSKPPMPVRVAKELADGIGWERAHALGKAYPEAWKVVADEKLLRKIPGVGKVLAKRIAGGL